MIVVGSVTVVEIVVVEVAVRSVREVVATTMVDVLIVPTTSADVALTVEVAGGWTHEQKVLIKAEASDCSRERIDGDPLPVVVVFG